MLDCVHLGAWAAPVPQADTDTVVESVVDLVVDCVQGDFAACPYAAIRRLTCESRGGRLVVTGHTPNFHTRQVALGIVARYCDLTMVEDRIKVRV